ncbi:uncharacterized protein LOC125228922 isoform X2 [Leguminivora glycinivorella]|uniref:uncharacterized protein LOC125228922 isoform X2 n=1 Tax=Leguminivora glycinivorella TaxID=1035111 RepID=UPI00200E7EE0|nr:uncharacterized protein LOC125228922 isoform X2 [Leguminivora glycinivorella]
MQNSATIDVFELGYMRTIRAALNTIAQWPNATFGKPGKSDLRVRCLEAYKYVIVAAQILAHIPVLLYLKKYFSTISFIDQGQIYCNIFLTAIFLQRASLPFQKKYRNTVKKFCLEFHLNHYNYKSDFATKETNRVNTLCKNVSRISLCQLFSGILAYNVVPLTINIYSGMFSTPMPENKTFVHSVDYLLPFDAYTDAKGYLLIFCFNWFPSYNIPTAMICYDLLIFTMVFHIWGHLNILLHDIKTFPRPKVACSEESKLNTILIDNREINRALKDIIDHHTVIKKFMTEVSETFDVTLCSYLAFHQVMCCLMLLECSSMEPKALGKYGILGSVIFQQLIQTSVVFELIHSKSETLGDHLYSIPWEDMDTDNKKLFVMFLNYVQKPFGMKACGMVPIGVLTMSAILRTSVSYFIMLRTLNNEEK